MTQPVRFSITNDFSSDEANGVTGRSTLRTAQLDALFSALQTTTDQICDNLELIQRDDGGLLDQVVSIASLSPAVLALLSSVAWTVRGAWVGGTAYSRGDIVLQGGIVYVCMVAHTANVFATDLAAGDWGQVTASSTAISTGFSPTATLVSTNVQSAIAELDSEVRPISSILNVELYNGL